MPNPIIKGTKDPIRKSVRVTFDPSQGFSVTEEFESGGNNLGGLAKQCQIQGRSYVHEITGHKSRLVATSSANNFTQEGALERWELFSNQNMLDVREHPNSVALGQANLAQVMKDWKRHEAGKTVFAYANPGQAALFNLLIRGVTHYPVWNWTLRYTANISNQFQLFTEANSGIGNIYTNAQAANSVPAGRLRSTIQSITAPPADANLVWGWLKTGVTEAQTAKNRVDVSAEYILAQWSVFLYT